MIKSDKVIPYLKFHSNTSHWKDKGYETGYHTLKVKDTILKGQRNPEKRLSTVNYDFTNKRVLDLGCNRGGMLFKIQDRVQYGVGIDYDSNLINCCNILKCHDQSHNLNFYTHNLDTMNILNLNWYGPFDIALMLSMSMWIKKWETYVNWIGIHCKACLFETNGSNQDDQFKALSHHYDIKVVNEKSLDDDRNHDRKLLLCTK